MLSSSTSHRFRLAAFSVAFASLAAAAIFWQPASVAARAGGVDPASAEFYTQNVLPILKTNCYRCHGAPNHRGGLTMNTQASLMKGGHDGPVIVPGDPAKSLLITLIRHEGPASDPKPMPPKGKLSDADIATITAWVKAGAIMPRDPAQ
ncbi:MAG TPA: c-type cytochrome domain-containing protein [Acidobacteriaceae bacterium]|nr:c-type cytochrome domain-containing protein [Acidobacteriaceae bacterium]